MRTRGPDLASGAPGEVKSLQQGGAEANPSSRPHVGGGELSSASLLLLDWSCWAEAEFVLLRPRPRIARSSAQPAGLEIYKTAQRREWGGRALTWPVPPAPFIVLCGRLIHSSSRMAFPLCWIFPHKSNSIKNQITTQNTNKK